jgi:hypothetical protein
VLKFYGCERNFCAVTGWNLFHSALFLIVIAIVSGALKIVGAVCACGMRSGLVFLFLSVEAHKCEIRNLLKNLRILNKLYYILLFFLVIAIVSGALKIVGAVCACVMSGEILKERAKEADRCVMLKMDNDVE